MTTFLITIGCFGLFFLFGFFHWLMCEADKNELRSMLDRAESKVDENEKADKWTPEESALYENRKNRK